MTIQIVTDSTSDISLELANELGITPNAVEKWKAGDRFPANSKVVIARLDQLVNRKHPPYKRSSNNKSSLKGLRSHQEVKYQ